jgi:hypothetical protein
MLEREGYVVSCVTSQMDFRMEVFRKPVDLVLLCQTLTDEERRDAVHFLEEFAPAIRCAVLQGNPAKDLPDGDVAVIAVSNGPVHFLQSITRMLPSPPSDSLTSLARPRN